MQLVFDKNEWLENLLQFSPAKCLSVSGQGAFQDRSGLALLSYNNWFNDSKTSN